MNTNRGMAISTSLAITEKARCTIRSSVCVIAPAAVWLPEW